MTGRLAPLSLALLAGGLVVAGAWIGWPETPEIRHESEIVGFEQELLIEPGPAVERTERWTVPLGAPAPDQAEVRLPTISLRQLAFGDPVQGAVVETVVRLDGHEVDRLRMDTTEPPSDLSWSAPRSPVLPADAIGSEGSTVEIVVTVTRPAQAPGTLVVLAGPVEKTSQIAGEARPGLWGAGWLPVAAAGASALSYLVAGWILGPGRSPGRR